MKSIESAKLIRLIGLIESNQVNKKFITYFSSICTEGPRTKLSIFLVVY